MDQISQIKQNIDIVTLVGTYVSLKKSGKNYRGLCPFHSERTPSFMVSPELQIFKCFGCGESGDIFSFLQKVEGIEFPTALEQLAEKAGIKLEKQRIDPEAKLKKQLWWINDQAAKFFNHLLTKHKLGKPGLDYLKKKRGLSDKTLKAFMLGYSLNAPDALFKYFSNKGVDEQTLLQAGLIIQKDAGGYMDKFRGRIMFPFTAIDGKVLGFTGRTIFDREPKYLNTAETPVFHKSLFIYGLDRAKVAIKKDGAVFVEGNMDVVSAHEAGFTNVIASSGTSLTPGQLKLVSRYTNDLTFCFDSDTAGVAASFRGIELAENMGFDIKVAIIPAGYKDIDELIKKSPDEATSILANAVPAYDYLLFSIIKKHNKGSPEGKKKIVDEIAPWFSRIKNKVLFDHYCKEIAKELGLNEDTVVDSINYVKTGGTVEMDEFPDTSPAGSGQQSIESYIIAILLTSGLDFMLGKVYNIDPEDFADEKLRVIAERLRDYLTGGSKKLKKFDPKHFEKDLDAETKTLFENLYLQESGIAANLDSEHLEREFNQSLLRLKKESAKRRMQKLSEEIRLAEKSNDVAAVKKLTKQFETLKKQLL